MKIENWKELKYHPLAMAIPTMSPERFADLVKSVKEHGLDNPIVIYEGQILDGRHRYRACLDLGREPMFVQFDGDNAGDYVLRQNLYRRDLILTATQRGAIVVKVCELQHGGDRKSNHSANLQNGISIQDAAKMLNVGTSGVKADAIKSHSVRLDSEETKSNSRPVRNTSRKDLAAKANVSTRVIDDVQYIKEHGVEVLLDKVIAGDISGKDAVIIAHGAKEQQDLALNLPDEKQAGAFVRKMKADRQEKQKIERNQKLEEARTSISIAARERLSSVCDIRHCSMAELFASGIKPDAVITDPPYPIEYLRCFEELAELAVGVPLVAVMSGQLHFPKVLAMMTKHLKWRWLLSYYTPGAPGAINVVSVNTSWKPVLLFGESLQWIGDTFKSDAPDKNHHEWGQSESGMFDLVSKLIKPGSLICDPFLGGGTTAVAALQHGCRFIGCDIDSEAVKKSIARIEVKFAK